VSGNSPESPEYLFRPEALAHHRRSDGAEPLEPLRIPGRRITRAYRAVGGLLAVSIAVLSLVRVDSRVRGRFVARRAPGAGDIWHVTATVDWRYREAVAGKLVRLSDDAGCLDLATRIVRQDDSPRLGDPGGPPSAPQVTLYAEIEGEIAGQIAGRTKGVRCAAEVRAGSAEVTIDTVPVIAVLFPQLRALIARLHEAT
jgi:hypothetical protein